MKIVIKPVSLSCRGGGRVWQEHVSYRRLKNILKGIKVPQRRSWWCRSSILSKGSFYPATAQPYKFFKKIKINILSVALHALGWRQTNLIMRRFNECNENANYLNYIFRRMMNMTLIKSHANFSHYKKYF